MDDQSFEDDAADGRYYKGRHFVVTNSSCNDNTFVGQMTAKSRVLNKGQQCLDGTKDNSA